MQATNSIVAMPFLKSLEIDDVLAIHGLSRLARYTGDGRLYALIEHPTLRNGITDDLTTLVAAAATPRDPDETSRMLDPGYTDIEVLNKGTELSPGLKISIVRAMSPHRRSSTANDIWRPRRWLRK